MKSYVYYSGQIRTLAAMATYSFYKCIIGNVSAESLGNFIFVLQKCLLSSRPRFMRLCPNRLI